MKRKLTCASVLAAAILLSAAALAEESENFAPIAENLEITTYRGVSAGGELKAVDPDGEKITFEISTPPTKGSVELGDDGSFVYTPDAGRRGKDYFGYRAVDSDGNCSQEATVIIRILKQKTPVSYTDMDGRAEGCAAVFLAENDIYTGEKLGGSYIFSPDEPVKRGEFLTMCMKAAGVEPISGAVTTGFYDDDKMQVWEKPFVTTALMKGIVRGMESADGRAVFSPDEPITAAQAAVILNRCFGVTDAVAAWARTEAQIPVWADQAVINLSGCDVMPRSMDAASPVVTRAEASVMLMRASEMASRR